MSIIEFKIELAKEWKPQTNYIHSAPTFTTEKTFQSDEWQLMWNKVHEYAEEIKGESDKCILVSVLDKRENKKQGYVRYMKITHVKDDNFRFYTITNRRTSNVVEKVMNINSLSAVEPNQYIVVTRQNNRELERVVCHNLVNAYDTFKQLKEKLDAYDDSTLNVTLYVEQINSYHAIVEAACGKLIAYFRNFGW